MIGKSDDWRVSVTKAIRPTTWRDGFHVLGIDPAAEIHDRFNRPLRLNNGSLIEPLFTGGVS